MSAEKKWNLQSFTTSSNVFGTNQTYTITCAGKNTFLNLNQADLILNLSTNNFNPSTETYSVIRPSTAWISQINTTVTFVTKDGEENVVYSGYNERGVAANVLELLEYSKPKFDMYSEMEFLTPQTNLTKTNFEVLIPLKFLNDASYDASLLNVDRVVFNISWENQSNIFDFGTNSSAYMSTNRVDIKFPTISVTDSEIIPRSIREIPNRRVYIATIDLPGGNSSVNASLGVDFPVSVVYYFFTGLDGLYTLNPNPNSVVTNHSITSMGQVYPLTSNYNASINTNVEVGLIRHYMELMDISGKDRPENSSILSYSNWKDINRIYSIEIGTEQNRGQQFNFVSNFATPTSAPSKCIMIFLGRKELSKMSTL